MLEVHNPMGGYLPSPVAGFFDYSLFLI